MVSLTESLGVIVFIVLGIWSIGEADGGLLVTVADEGLTGIVFVCKETRKEVEWSP